MVDNTTLYIACILMKRPISRRSRRSAQRVRVVVDVMMDVTVVEAVDVVEDAKVTTKSGETIRGIVIEIIGNRKTIQRLFRPVRLGGWRWWILRNSL